MREQREFFTENRGHFLHREFDFENMTAGLIAGLWLALTLRRGKRLTDVAVALTDAAGAVLAIAKYCGFSICGRGMLMRSRPFLPINSPRLMYLLRLLFKPCRGRVLRKPLMVAFNLLSHSAMLQASYPIEQRPRIAFRWASRVKKKTG